MSEDSIIHGTEFFFAAYKQEYIFLKEKIQGIMGNFF